MHLLLEEEAAPQEPVEIDIDAPPAWGQVLAGQDNLPTEAPAVETVLAEPDEADSGRDHAVVEDEVEETTAPAASAEPEPAPAADSEPDGALAAGSEPPGTDPPSVGDLLGSPTPTPFRGVPVSHGLTIRRGSRPVGSREEPEPAETELDRGDMGEGRVGQTLEAARIHGLEVLHGFDVASGVQPIDHLVIAVNGLWVIRAQDVLTGRLAATTGSLAVPDPTRIGRLSQESEDDAAPLSTGQRRRRDIARLLATGPAVLLLDEPTNHLSIDAVTRLTRALEETSAAVVLVTHDRQMLRDTAHWPRLKIRPWGAPPATPGGDSRQ